MTVKAWLKGHPFDLEALAELFPVGDTRVVKEGDQYYLTASEINSPPDGQKFYDTAPTVLQRVNGLARAMRPNDYKPVELVGRYQVDENRHLVVVVDRAEVRGQALPATVVVGSARLEARAQLTAAGTVTRNGEPVPPSPPPGAKYVALASTHPDVAEALTIMGKTEPSWVELYKVFEIIEAAGAILIARQAAGLQPKDVKLFTRTANHQDASGASSRHARNKAQAPKSPMSIADARHLIGRLVTAWLDSLG